MTDNSFIESDLLREIGGQLGEFQLLRKIGQGGMAEVWLAEQTSLKRNVALKLLRPDLMTDETYVARFHAEAKAAAGLNHPNIVQVYAIGCEKGLHFIVQEYLQGQTLKSLMQRKGPFDLPAAILVVRQVASALAAAAERGIVHRDIKPENIMLTRKGEAKVMDFGLAQLQGGDRLNLTQEGVTMGTPLYMSPEQVSGKSLDQRSDIYSLGITFYHMLTGQTPFQGDHAVSVAVKHLHDAPPSVLQLRPDLPEIIQQMMDQMIAKNPDDRYQNAQSIVQDLRELGKALRTGESLDHLKFRKKSASFLPFANPKLMVPLIGLVLFLTSAALGWAMRPKVPPVNSQIQDRMVPAKATAEEQYLHAMFEIDNEEAFQEVINRFTHPDDTRWRNLAHEQLAMLYLKDPQSWDRAEQQLKELTTLDPGNPRYAAQARIGQAYLYALKGNMERASQILLAERDNFEDYLTGSWKQLEDETGQMIRDQERRRNGNPSR